MLTTLIEVSPGVFAGVASGVATAVLLTRRGRNHRPPTDRLTVDWAFRPPTTTLTDRVAPPEVDGLIANKLYLARSLTQQRSRRRWLTKEPRPW
jgi:hypothetical protein